MTPRISLLLLTLAAAACSSDRVSAVIDEPAQYDLVFEGGYDPLLTQATIFSLGDDGVRRLLLGSAVFAGQPSVSADGRTMVYLGSGTSEMDPQSLWLWRRNGGVQRIPLAPGIVYSPALSPDGSRIAYIRLDDQGKSQLWTAKVDGSQAVQLTLSLENAGTVSAGPAWSPDGSKLAFSAGLPGALSLWVMEANGQNLQRITTSPSSDIDAAWSPDGKKLAFLRGPSPLNDLMVIDLATKQVIPFSLGGRNRNPAWSPDGQQIAIASTRDGGSDMELWLVRADRSVAVRLTDNDVQERRPAWMKR